MALLKVMIPHTKKTKSARTMRFSCYSHALCRFGNNDSVSPTVILGFIVGQKQSWKLVYFLFSRGVKCHLECKLDYQKYGMLC